MMKNLFTKGCFTHCEPKEHIIYSNTNNTYSRSVLVHFRSVDAPNRSQISTDTLSDNDASKQILSDLKFSFIYNRFNIRDYPICQLHKCILTAHMQMDIKKNDEHSDNLELITKISQWVHERRNINAAQTDIIITHGMEDSIRLIASALSTSKTVVGVENPGHIKFAKEFTSVGAQIRPLPEGFNSIIAEESLRECDYLCITPTNHYPSTATMPLERRQELISQAVINNTIIIEEDVERDVNFLDNPIPALKSIDTSGQVIYVSNLSDSISPRLKIGYIIANRAIIQKLRLQQKLKHCQVSLYSQQVAVNFISFGYYDNHVRRIQSMLEKKWITMITSLESDFKDFKDFEIYASPGSFFIGIKLPMILSSQMVIDHAGQCGVVVDPGNQIFSDHHFNEHFITLGFGALDDQQVKQGIAKLSGVIKTLLKIEYSSNLSTISDTAH